jgi:outer membrane biosynthesis protein TonB
MAKQTGGVSSGWHPGGGLPDQEWKLPLFLAVALHAAALALALASPVLFDRRPSLPEIHTVNLFNAVEGGPAAVLKKAPAKKTAPPAVVEPQARKIKASESEPIQKDAPAPPPPKAAPAKAPAVSERPLPSKTAKDQAKLREIKRTLADRQAKEAEQLAQQQVKSALATIRDLYQKETVTAPAAGVAEAPMPAAAPAPAAPPASSTAGGSGGSEGAIVEEVLRRYLAAVHARIQQHWTLPDLQSWDDSLEALIVIKVRKDGIVTGNFFEKRSENFYFNQFVEKAVREASPFSPFPSALTEDQLEIGLRFRPGEIF